MIEAIHTLAGVQIAPQNAEEIGYKLNFSGEEGVTQGEINVDRLVLDLEAKALVLNHIDTNGIMQGIPYTIQIESVVLEYYIDLVDSPKLTREGGGSIEVKVKKRKSFDWFKKNADVLSWEAVNRTNPISTLDTKYVIVRDNQGMIVLTSLMAAYSLGVAIIQQTKSLLEAIGDLVAAFEPQIGVGATGPVVTAFRPGAIAWAFAKAVIQAAFLLLTILAFINMMRNIVRIIYPRVRELKSSTIHELITKGCQKLGFTFESSIITPNSAYTILPVPIVDTKTTSIFLESLLPPIQSGYTKGYPTGVDTIKTLGSLVDEVLKLANGKVFIDGTVVRIERRDQWKLTSSRTVRKTLTNQSERRNQYTYNTDELWKRSYMHFQVDFSDTHTTDNSAGTKCEYSTEPNNVVETDLVNIRGLKDIPIGFAFGTRKDEFNPAEKFWKDICVSVDKAAGFFGATSNMAAKVKGRIGVMQISSPQYSVTKLLYQIGGKQPVNYRDYLAADFWFNKYHRINDVDLNLKEIYSMETLFSSKDFEALQDNNYIYTEDGEHLEILNFDWINKGKKARIEYAIPSTSPTNTHTLKIYG